MFVFEDSFQLESNVVTTLAIAEPYLIISNDIGTIQLRNLDSLNQLEWELYRRNTRVSCVATFNSLLYVGKQDNTIEIWDLVEKELVNEFQTRVGKPRTIRVTKDYIIIVGDTGIEILDQEMRKVLGILENHQPFGKISIKGKSLAAQISSEEIEFWNLNNLKKEFTFQKEEWISSFLNSSDFLLVGTNECMEFDDDCFLHIWKKDSMEMIKQLGGWLENDYYFDLKVRKPFPDKNPQVLALAAYTLDIWELNSWKHIAQINELPWAQSCELYGNMIFISDVNGNIQLWQKQ